MTTTDKRALDSLVHALQKQIVVANELGLDFAVRLLRMAVIEVRLNANQISQAEVEELCLRIENDTVDADQRPAAEVINLAEVAFKRRL